jgi:MOSC domain-containing protein YiiM
MNAEVKAIFISPAKGAPMQPIQEVRAITGIGLEGDRYAKRAGAYTGVRIPDEDRAITLISVQAIEEANQELVRKGVEPFSPEQTRRNILINIDPQELNSLVGKRFILSDVELEGSELCDPCRRPAAVLKRGTDVGKAFEEAFQNRGGLRARIISDGSVTEGSNLQTSEIQLPIEHVEDLDLYELSKKPTSRPASLQKELDLIEEVFSPTHVPSEENKAYIADFIKRAHAEMEKRRIDADATPEKHFDGLVRNLRDSIQKGMVSFTDSDAAELFYFLQEHPELSSSQEELDARLEALNAFVGAAWKAPGWEEKLNLIRNPRLSSDND